MLIDNINVNVNAAEAIPYRNFKQMIRIVKRELKKNRYIEIWENVVYSEKKQEVRQ